MSHRQELPQFLARSTATKEGFLSAAKNYDYFEILFTDINGVARGKVVPAWDALQLVTEGCEVIVTMLTYAFDGNNSNIEDHKKYDFGNVIIRPITSTLRRAPTAGQATNSKIGQLFGSAYWSNGQPIEADSRAMAVRQLERLNQRGFDLLSGTEVELQLFELDKTFSHEEPQTGHDTVNSFLPRHYRQYEKFYVELDRYIRAQQFAFDTFHTEPGRAKIEMALKPDWGILSADNVARFKLLAHDSASNSGYRCSFMSKPRAHEAGCSFHFNHSIWRRSNESDEPTENVMFDENDPEKISSFTRHWIAGLLHHGHALTAILSPTVNCYRQLHCHLGPTHDDWDFDNRLASLRVRNRGTAKKVFIENRIPSSASNPYLVMASIIAAGLDGVDRKLELPPKKSRELGALPRTLPAALDALLKDTILCKALGCQFIDWFVTIKRKEIEDLKGVDVTTDRPVDFRRERKLYFYSP